MAKSKYQFNKDTLSYEKIELTFREKTFRLFSFLSVTIVSCILLNIAIWFVYDSPKERHLRREKDQLELQYEILNDRLGDLEIILSELQDNDENLYRVIYQADPLPKSIREAGFGGADRYKKLQGYDNSKLIIETTKKLDKLAKQMYIQSKSYNELWDLANTKIDILSSIPAIQPISNKDLTRLASGFGWRLHPIYHVNKFHEGLDFTAPTGTEIYATGNGIVESVEYSGRGYGNHIIINHGFGYKSLYAHMSKINVKKGDEIKRGNVIGLVGNSGSSTGPHLHYEVHVNNQKVDPINYFYNDLTPEEYEKMLIIASQANQTFD